MPLMMRSQFPKAVNSSKPAKRRRQPGPQSTKVDAEKPKAAVGVESTRIDDEDDGDTTVSQAVPMASLRKRGRKTYA